MITTKAKQTVNKSTKSRNQDNRVRTRPHMTIPIQDLDWALNQSPTVLRLFNECWKSDPFGSRWMPLNTTLKGDNLRKAKKVLREIGLFNFEVRMRVVGSDRHYETYVINYHGSRSNYWKLSNQVNNQNMPTLDGSNQTVETHERTDNPGSEPETPLPQESRNPSGTFQEHISNSSKELMMCVEETAPPEISLTTQTRSLPDRIFYPASFAADAPLGGTSPLVNESAYEEKEKALCAIVEGKQDILVMSCSKSLDSLENSQFPDRDKCSAAPPPVAEKWSDEAIATRMHLRPGRQDKLKRVALFGDYPGFEYLQECWDDLSLRIVIKRLIAKFPQWRVACIEEKLVNWNEG